MDAFSLLGSKGKDARLFDYVHLFSCILCSIRPILSVVIEFLDYV
jgi:hypothetical protein